mmetsp:Transcript_6269/g.8328  ORF Transcript_6269/g.8328 Transcript_6269/m.8328 type:complete len:1027 (+) Transcript_6269:734-3814(+)
MNMLPPFLTMSTVSMSSDDIIINGDTGQDHHCTEPEGIQGELLVKVEFLSHSSVRRSTEASSNCEEEEPLEDTGNSNLKEITDPLLNQKRRKAILNAPLPPPSSLPPLPLSSSTPGFRSSGTQIAEEKTEEKKELKGKYIFGDYTLDNPESDTECTNGKAESNELEESGSMSLSISQERGEYLEGGEEIFQGQQQNPAVLQFGDDLVDDLEVGEEHDNWNLRFQRTLDRFREINILHERDEYDNHQTKALNRHLINLAQDFYWNARNYGKIIISEHFLPSDRKTIKPADDFSEGAGGTKYVIHNIIFKFATAGRHGLYSDDAHAAKVTAHELKGLTCYFNCNIQDLCFPMMVLVDYRGFRVSAVSRLPITGDRSLIYGSSNRGKTVHAENEVFNHKMEQMAKIIGLKPHWVGRDLEYSKKLCAPFDVEGHVGTDNRYYLLDFSRVMPPEKRDRNFQGGILFQLLRPEFVMRYVKKHKKPLCPDAYSPQVEIHNPQHEHDKEVVEASEYLYNTVIHLYSRHLVQTLQKRHATGEKVENFRLTESLHSHGINVRHLGRLIAAVSNLSSTEGPSEHERSAVTLVLCEVCARVIKNRIRARLRETMRRFKVVLEEPCRRAAVDYLNLVFSDNFKSTEHWDTQIKSEARRCFANCLDFRGGECADLKSVVLSLNSHSLHYIFERVVQMSGLSFTKELMQSIQTNSEFFEGGRAPIDETDLIALNERIKHMNIVSLAQGYLHLVKGREVRVVNPNLALRSFRSAIHKFEEALDTNTTSKMALRNLGSALLYLETELTRTQKESVSFQSPNIIRADQCFRRAIEIDPLDAHTCRMYAKLLVKCSLPKKAEHWYLRALEINPNNPEVLYEYQNLLCYTFNLRDGKAFQDRFQKIQSVQSSQTTQLEQQKQETQQQLFTQGSSSNSLSASQPEPSQQSTSSLLSAVPLLPAQQQSTSSLSSAVPLLPSQQQSTSSLSSSTPLLPSHQQSSSSDQQSTSSLSSAAPSLLPSQQTSSSSQQFLSQELFSQQSSSCEG